MNPEHAAYYLMTVKDMILLRKDRKVSDPKELSGPMRSVYDAIVLAIDATKRDAPLPVKTGASGRGFSCPGCGRRIKKGVKFCGACGQRIDWTKEANHENRRTVR